MREKKEILSYLIFGGLTFLVSVTSYAIFDTVLSMNELIANVLSWILAVSFAYVTNKKWVFDAPTHNAQELLKQVSSFFGGRVATLLVEEFILLIFVTLLKFPSIPVKVVAQIIVIVLNYIISKWFIFKNK